MIERKPILKNSPAAAQTNKNTGPNDGAQFLKGPVILPVMNPTGNPYTSKSTNYQQLQTKIKDINELRGLQVKAELNKLADPSPAFA